MKSCGRFLLERKAYEKNNMYYPDSAFVALFSTSAYFIFDHYRQEEQQAELYDSLADIVDSAAETEEEPAEPILYTEEKTVLPELAELCRQNRDLAGWIV